MKKFLKGIAVALALALVITPCAILFAGCGEPSFEGEWKLYQITMQTGENEYETFNLGDEFEGGGILTEDFMTFTFNTDGTWTATTIEGDFNGTWEKTDNGYTINIGENPVNAVIEDGKLKIIADDECYILQK